MNIFKVVPFFFISLLVFSQVSPTGSSVGDSFSDLDFSENNFSESVVSEEVVGDLSVPESSLPVQTSVSPLQEYYLSPGFEELSEENQKKAADVKKIGASPSISYGTPTGFGSKWLDVYAGVEVVNRNRFEFPAESDGWAWIGLGLLDPVKWVGVNLTLNLVDLDGKNTLKEGGVSIHVARQIYSGFSVALGYDSFTRFGPSLLIPSLYLVASHLFRLNQSSLWFNYVALTLGVGNGRFLAENNDNIQTARDKAFEGANVFGSLALNVHPKFNVMTSWTGQNLNAGISWTPFQRSYRYLNGFKINLAALDLISGKFQDQDGVRFGGSLSWSSRFF